MNSDEFNYSNLDYVAVLKSAFDLLEEGVLRLSREVGCRDGTTATTVLITGDNIYCANTGKYIYIEIYYVMYMHCYLIFVFFVSK